MILVINWVGSKHKQFNSIRPNGKLAKSMKLHDFTTGYKI